MTKKLLPVLIALPLFAVNAQTFQRRAQQPAFFMPKSVMTEQQPERLPSVGSMNYQGQRISDNASSPFFDASDEIDEPKKIENVEKNNVPTEAVVPALKQYAAPKPAEVKPVKKVQKQPSLPETASKETTVTKTTAVKNDIAAKKGSDNYQDIFAEIQKSHKKDLKLISEGQKVNNPEIEQMLESYEPKVHTITDTIDIRTLKL